MSNIDFGWGVIVGIMFGVGFMLLITAKPVHPSFSDCISIINSNVQINRTEKCNDTFCGILIDIGDNLSFERHYSFNCYRFIEEQVEGKSK